MPYHKTLQRQISKFSGEELLRVISETYQHFDEDRALLERSLELSSRELEELNIQLQSEQIIIENKVEQRTLELKAERNKIAVTLASIVDTVIVVDLKRNIIIFNKAAEKLTGYKLADALGKPLDQIIKLFDNVTELSPDTFCPVSSDGFEGIAYSKEGLELIGLNGKEAYVNLLAGQIREGKNANLGCILTLYDVTKEKQLEEMKLDFVAMAAHELRTPLTSIKGYLYIFMRDYLKFMDEEQTTILQRLNISAQKLSSLIENLLNVSRIERKSLNLNLQPIDWVSNIQVVILEFMEQVKDKKQELIFDSPSERLPQVKADPLRINEILSNLLSNAVNYTAPGGKIRVWVETKGDEIITHVSDTGQGIPKEALPHLFTKFFRVSSSLEPGSKGTGLGLYIAKSIINLHNGRIWVESEVGRGSTFSFSLPITSQNNNERR